MTNIWNIWNIFERPSASSDSTFVRRSLYSLFTRRSRHRKMTESIVGIARSRATAPHIRRKMPTLGGVRSRNRRIHRGYASLHEVTVTLTL